MDTFNDCTVIGLKIPHGSLDRLYPCTLVIGENEMSGTKFDGGKTKLHLLPFDALEEVGKVLTYGAAKYGEYNWRSGMGYSRLMSAALRHIFAHMRGERYNHEPEVLSEDGTILHPATNYLHLAHAACDLLMLVNYILTGEGTNDLFTGDSLYEGES